MIKLTNLLNFQKKLLKPKESRKKLYQKFLKNYPNFLILKIYLGLVIIVEEVQMQLNRMYCTKMQIPMAQFSN